MEPVKWWLRWFDLFERVGWTFVQSFISSVVVTSGGMGLTDVKIALGAAAIAALKSASVETTVKGQLKVIDGLADQVKATVGRKRAA